MLALLAAEGGPVSQERLVNELWRDRPPIAARKALQTSVWRLRSVLPRGVVVNGLGGYELPVDGELDIARFERLVCSMGEKPWLEVMSNGPGVFRSGDRAVARRTLRRKRTHRDSSGSCLVVCRAPEPRRRGATGRGAPRRPSR